MKIKQPILLFVEFLKSETTGLLHIKKFDIDNAFSESFGYISYDEYCRVVEPLQKNNNELIRVIELAGDVLEQCDEAMHYMSEYDIPIMLPDNVKSALSEIRKLKGE